MSKLEVIARSIARRLDSRRRRRRLLVQSLDASVQPVAFDGVARRAGQQRAADLALDQVVLGAGLDRRHRRVDVVETGEGDQREVRQRGAKTLQRLEADAVRQAEVEQHDVDVATPRQLERLGERRGAHQLEAKLRHLAQRLDDQARVAGLSSTSSERTTVRVVMRQDRTSLAGKATPALPARGGRRGSRPPARSAPPLQRDGVVGNEPDQLFDHPAHRLRTRTSPPSSIPMTS
jgi:hypothetical protein